MKRPKRCGLRLCVRLSESSGADMLCRSGASDSAMRPQLQSRHTSVLSLSQTPTVQPELSPFTLCTLTSKEFSSLTLCTPTCLECSPFLSTSYLSVAVVPISKHLSKPLAESPYISLNPDMLEELSSFTVVHADVHRVVPLHVGMVEVVHLFPDLLPACRGCSFH